MNLKQKEGLLKMSGNNKVYKGTSYEFTLGGFIGRGGNGRVVEAVFKSAQCDKACVVKILHKWRDIEMMQLRYKRFNKEINKVLKLQNEVSGIMKILDFYCPDEMQGNSEVWYLMYKAQGFREFSISNHIGIKDKIKYLLELSNILCALHERGSSHRDIKVDNLLVLDNQLILSDFGLIWDVNDDRITGEDDRLGPYFIGPPELENRDTNMDDFRPSDVYLFAKVVWMVLKGDTFGFRGGYERVKKEFYLDSSKVGITTFEPVHQLLEQSTKSSINDRISIKECRELLINQLAIINGDMSKDKVEEYRYKELEMEIVNNDLPDERIYRSFDAILSILESLTPISNKVIEGPNEIINADSIEMWTVDKSLIFKSKPYNRQVYTYLCYPDYIKYINEKEEFELHIKKVEREDIHSEFISYKESKMESWGSVNSRIFLNEPLVIRFEKRG
jgi:serine/threonine protein kinase